MPKGKNFTAAEKHFQPLLDKERKEKHALYKHCSELSAEVDSLKTERDCLQSRISELQEQIEHLQKLLNMDDAEREQFVRSCHGVNAVANLLVPVMQQWVPRKELAV